MSVGTDGPDGTGTQSAETAANAVARTADRDDAGAEAKPERAPEWRAPASVAAVVVAVAVTAVSLATEKDPPEWLGLFWRPAFEVWSGAWWVLATSVFPHLDVIHLAFNGYWMFLLAAPAERLAGSGRAALFCVATATFSSAFELLCADDVGVGLSGVVYAVFGFSWRRSKTDPVWAPLVPPDVVRLFLGWFVLCIVLTELDVFPVANFAHLGGLLGGLAIARATEAGVRPAMRAALLGAPAAVMAALLVLGPPWSGSLHAARAYRALVAEDAKAALPLLERAEALGFDRLWCLEQLAWAYRAEQRPADHERTMEEVRKLDPEAHRALAEHLRSLKGGRAR